MDNSLGLPEEWFNEHGWAFNPKLNSYISMYADPECLICKGLGWYPEENSYPAHPGCSCIDKNMLSGRKPNCLPKKQ